MAEKIARLEAQAAAMQIALEIYGEKARAIANTLKKMGTGEIRSENYVMAVLTELSLDGGKRAEAALLPDAGKALLAVAEAAEEWATLKKQGGIEATVMVDAERKIRKALGAWRKPK